MHRAVEVSKGWKMHTFSGLISVFLCLCLGESNGRIEIPKISVGGWMSKDIESEWNHNSTPPLNPPPFPNSISVPSSVQGMSLICNASFPIEWRFHQARWDWRAQLQFAVQTTRISNGLDVVGFSSELSFLSHASTISGNYVCQKVGFPDLSSSLYVFWEGNSPPFLTLANLYRKPPQIPYKRESSVFVLPCSVSVPGIVPTLSKEGGPNQTDIPIPQNRSVTYDPRYGFTLKNLKDPYGRWTCQIGDAEEEGDGDIITFNVIDADDSPQLEFNETLRHGAYYNIDSTKKELTCCSAGDKPPKLKLVECDHPTICAVMKHSLHSMESQKKKNGSCSSLEIHGKRAGVFRCVGAGVDVVREFFYPMPDVTLGLRFRGGGRGHGKRKDENVTTTTPAPTAQPPEDPYFDWYEAESEKMMQVTELTSPLYIGETRNFTCKVSHFYYAKGIVWAIVYTNQSIEYLDGKIQTISKRREHRIGLGQIRHFQILFGRYQSFIEMEIVENLDTVICYAPVWNSTEWGKKAISMEIHAPTEPKIIGRMKEEYTWFLNDTNKALVCKFDGEPTPNITWTRDNKTFQHTPQNDVNGTSKLVFQTVSLDAQSTYECVASNVAGTVVKKFRITVIHSASSILMVVSTVAVMGLVFVAIATVFLCRYLKSQKSVMQHLANLAFKDVTNNANNSHADTAARGAPVHNTAASAIIYTNTNGSATTTHHHVASGLENVSINGRNNIDSSGLDLHFSDLHTEDPVHPDPGGYHKL